jgi:hypothetical protein
MAGRPRVDGEITGAVVLRCNPGVLEQILLDLERRASVRIIYQRASTGYMRIVPEDDRQ